MFSRKQFSSETFAAAAGRSVAGILAKSFIALASDGVQTVESVKYLAGLYGDRRE